MLTWICAVGMSLSLQAQNIFGTWQNTAYQMQYTFTQEGTYQFSSTQFGQASGNYLLQGGYLYLYDANNNPSVQYYLSGITAQQLHLSDVNQVQFTLDRVGVAPEVKGMEAFSKSKYPRVLAGSGKQQIIEADARLYAAAISFLVQTNIPEIDYKKIESALIKDFKTDAASTMTDLQALRSGMEYIFTLHDPVEIGLVRQQILGNIYWMSVVNKHASVYWDVTDSYTDVIAFDETNKLVLTQKDLDDYLDYLSLAYQNYGQQLTAAMRSELAQQMVSNFAALRLEDKQLLACGSLLKDNLVAQMNAMSSREQQQFQQHLQQQPPSVDWSGADMDADMVKFLMEMNNMSHVSMMNVIENMGGGDDYWELKQTDDYGNIIW